jgi:hypothetical protein
MKKIMAWAFFLALFPAWVMASPAPAAEASASQKILALLDSTLEKIESTDSYTAVFDKEETVHGRKIPLQTMAFKFKKPLKVYIAGIAPYAGQELLYVPGENKGKVLGHKSGFFSWVVLAIDPVGKLAMRDNRYPITAVGLANLDRLLRKNLLMAQDQGGLKATLNEAEDQGVPCWRADMEFGFKDAQDTDADACHAWFDRGTGLLRRVDIERPVGTRVGFYRYSQIDLAADLKDEDFSRKNPHYHF